MPELLQTIRYALVVCIKHTIALWATKSRGRIAVCRCSIFEVVCVVLKMCFAIDFDGCFTVVRLAVAMFECHNIVGMVVLPTYTFHERETIQRSRTVGEGAGWGVSKSKW